MLYYYWQCVFDYWLKIDAKLINIRNASFSSKVQFNSLIPINCVWLYKWKCPNVDKSQFSLMKNAFVKSLPILKTLKNVIIALAYNYSLHLSLGYYSFYYNSCTDFVDEFPEGVYIKRIKEGFENRFRTIILLNKWLILIKAVILRKERLYLWLTYDKIKKIIPDKQIFPKIWQKL